LLPRFLPIYNQNEVFMLYGVVRLCSCWQPFLSRFDLHGGN
jgi:hypothetical protein